MGRRKQKGLRSFRFTRNEAGEVRCPMCGVGMLQRQTNPNLPLAEHFECPKSGLIFYGDPESLYLCLNVEEDVLPIPF